MIRPHDYLIREAGLGDTPGIARLVAQFSYPVTAEEMESRSERLLSRQDYRIFVAESSDKLVGMVGAYLAYALRFSRQLE